ncbi:gluconate 2-dehydrogenase subunit 3 family protein [Paraconexibacter sp.]|uniref:gluconate 2-dehydrogenase subunit 3 family protein n=1 Tax=Paraconexibacter sp. TaxID=2949640 RepID=UPI0035664BE2
MRETSGAARGGTTRREALRTTGGMTLAVLAGSMLGEGGVAVAVEPGRAAYLDETELATLRAAVDVFIPADQDGGAVAAGCAEAIDALLGAFSVTPPRIYAGGPFSDRAGATRNDFARFLKLDRYEERAWRLRIEGSGGRAMLERNGPVKGWQRIYREGLAALADEGFAGRSRLERERVLRGGGNAAVGALVEIAWPHTWQFFYGAPEYGGNRDLVGWKVASWDGDVHPRGWTREEVESGPIPGTTVLVESLPLPLGELVALSAFAGSSELVHNLMVRADGRAAPLRDAVAPVLERAKEVRDDA